MSYDLQVWATAAAEAHLLLREDDGWRPEADAFVRPGRGWQIVVGPELRVEVEDIPSDIRTLLPGIRYVRELNLEPHGAPKAAQAMLRKAASVLATAGYGAIADPQTSEVSTPSGVRRYRASPTGRAVDALMLSWFSVAEPLRSQLWLRELVNLIELVLPEALPARYGECEPPQHKLAESGREHLIDFLASNYLDPKKLGHIVWYARLPVLGVDLHLGAGPSRSGWRSHRCSISVEAAVLEQGGWSGALLELWRRGAHLSRAFYADVRTLRQQRRGSATVAEWLAADRHPVCSSFWAGVPRTGGHAVALGPPYTTLWSEFSAQGERERDLVFLQDSDWRRHDADVFARLGGVPETIAIQSSGYASSGLGPNRDRVYPSVWPFPEATGPTQ